jgi:hypothetical protein
MTNKEIKYQKSLIDMKLGGLELKLALTHGLLDDEKQNILKEINTLKDKRLALSAFRLS